MSHILLVEHETLGAQAVVKVLPAGSSQQMERYLQYEATLLARVNHPNIVRVHDFGELPDGGHYLVMEHLTGIDLASYIEFEGRMPAARALWVLRQIASAIDYLHGLGIVHRDIKPANIMLDPSAHDAVKVIDLGIARQVDRQCPDEAPGTLAGTPAYMPPEQARGEPVGPAADNYAFGALALELLTGDPPFEHRVSYQLMLAAVSRQPELPSARGLEVEGLDAVFARALAKAPDERFASAGAMVEAVERVFERRSLAIAGERVRKVAGAPHALRFAQRGPLAFGVAGH